MNSTRRTPKIALLTKFSKPSLALTVLSVLAISTINLQLASAANPSTSLAALAGDIEGQPWDRSIHPLKKIVETPVVEQSSHKLQGPNQSPVPNAPSSGEYVAGTVYLWFSCILQMVAGSALFTA